MATRVKLERVSYTRGLTISQSEFGGSGRQVRPFFQEENVYFLTAQTLWTQRSERDSGVTTEWSIFFFSLADGTGNSMETLVLESMVTGHRHAQ